MKVASDKANIRRTASLLRTVAVLLILVCLCASLCSCQMIGAKFRPGAQKNAQWMSEDGSIFIQSDDSGSTYGYIIVNDEKIPISAVFANYGRVFVQGYTSEGCIINLEYDQWGVVRCIEDGFKIIVDHSVFFKPDEEISFRKLEDSEKIEYEPSSFTSIEGNIVYDNVVDKNADILYSVIEEHTHSLDEQYDPHLMAIGILKYGIKEICEPRLMSDYGGLITVGFADVEGASYYLTYDIEDHKVVKISSAG